MGKRLLGIIDATTYHHGLHDLILHRSVAAIPFGGRYRLIDFILSNMVNSRIESVAIFPKYQYRSLMDHLGSGKNWDLDRKRDGLFFFPSPVYDTELSGIGSFESFKANLDFLEKSTQEYTLIANCFTVFNMDFNPVLNWHIGSGCDITELRHNGISMDMYLIKTSLLINLINQKESNGYTCMKDVVTDTHSPLKLCVYEHSESILSIDSIKSYYKASMDILNPEVWRKLYLKERPIYTKVKDEPPTRYMDEAFVKNSMVANGGFIEGTVENSIIARGVRIGKGTIVRNSIILQKSQIGENCFIEAAILDKDVVVKSNTKITGSADSPVVIRKGTIQGALMTS